MSDLVYQNYNNRCQGWINPSNLLFGPQIISLSGYQSPAGSSTLVSINGTGFFSYSSIHFGTFTPTTYFINSNIIQFYIPSTLNSGTFPIQVFNGSVGSNIVNYTIDNASGFWLIQGSNIINSNGNNSGGVGLSWLSRGAPISISSDYDFTNLITNPDANNISWIICNNASPITITLPAASVFKGREIMFKNTTGQDVVSSYNIISLTGTSTTIILTGGAGKWATLVSDGSSWIIMQSG